MVDLYTALKLCSHEEYIRINGQEYTHKQITEKFDLRKIKVCNISYDLWHECMYFDIKREEN